ncbi:MAG: AgmX/PglI C-terminal domain-containing protein [Myxococcota bacterium]|jgi:hypothetical protein|nr:AgmX/PglI C-terminal domain-containing protein [Myxococcota bacterium]
MSGQPSKLMRVGIFQGERCIEERLMRKPGPITIGQTLSNSFVVPASSMPKSHKLFDYAASSRNYVLQVSETMGGRISVSGSDVVDLTRLRSVPNAKRTEDGYALALTERSRGKITIGDTRILFQFVSPPSTAAILPMSMGGGVLASLLGGFFGPAFLVALFVSAMMQIGPLAYVILNDWPQTDGFDELPDWYLKDAVEVAEEVEEDKPEEAPPEEVDGEFSGAGDEPSEVPEEAPAPVAKPAESKPRTAEMKTLSKTRGKSLAIGVMGVSEGGDASLGAALARDMLGTNSNIAGSLAGLSADDIGGSGGPGGGLGLTAGGAGSATGEPGIKTVEGGTSASLTTTADTTDKPVDRPKPKLKFTDETKVPTTVDEGDKSGIQGVFKSKKGQIENCYKRVIQSHGDLRGKLVMNITIGTDGKVLKTSVVTDEIKHDLSACIEGKIKAWKFPKLAKPVTIAKRWVFG